MGAVMDIQQDQDVLLSEKRAAQLLGLSEKTLQKWRLTGTGPQFVKISARCIRYRRRDLTSWAEVRLRSSTAAA